jgi:uncharacterized protein (TIGR02145 family)
MKHIFLIALVAIAFASQPLRAQTIMNIHQSNGTVIQLPLNTIDSITYTMNGGGTAGTLHTCGTANVHNPDLTYGTMTDQEGNVYKTIVIGTQEWMAENLNTSIYLNGDAIPTNLNDSEWSATTNGAWAYYNNDPSYACPYGKLYNWYTCVDARELCPVGWHVPSDEERSSLINFLEPYADGGNSPNAAGGKMKTTGTIEDGTGLWYAPNSGATNSRGSSGIPGGLRDHLGQYAANSDYGFWWSSSEESSGYGSNLHVFNNGEGAFNGFSSHIRGISVRCLRD